MYKRQKHPSKTALCTVSCHCRLPPPHPPYPQKKSLTHAFTTVLHFSSLTTPINMLGVTSKNPSLITSNICLTLENTKWYHENLFATRKTLLGRINITPYRPCSSVGHYSEVGTATRLRVGRSGDRMSVWGIVERTRYFSRTRKSRKYSGYRGYPLWRVKRLRCGIDHTSPPLATRLTFWPRNYFLLILAHPVYKTWIIQEPNTLQLWNKMHFEERKKTESIHEG